MKAEAYSHFPEKHNAPKYLPDFSVDSVLDIDFEFLRSIGVKHILFDLDLTLRKAHAPEIEADIISYLVAQHNAGMFHTLNLATNNYHDVSAFSEPLNARVFQPFVYKGRPIRKPSRRFFQRIIDDLQAEPHEIVMIGDKVQFDVGGGNKMGMHTILVKPQGKDLLHDRLLFVRMREKRLLRAARSLAEAIQSDPQK